MKKLGKMVLSGTLAAAVILSIAACGTHDDVVDESGRPIVTLFTNGGDMFEGVRKDSVWEKIEEETGVSLKFSGATHNADYYTVLNPKINTGEVFDIIFTVPSNMGGAYENWVSQDIFWDLDELIAEKPGEYPWIEKTLNIKKYNTIQYGGGMHTLLPEFNSPSGWGIYYRTDWLEAVGEEIPETMEDFTRVLQKFTQNDPDKNGKNDTWGMSPNSNIIFWNPLYHAFGVTPGYDIDENGDIKLAYACEEFRDFLGWANEMYEAGYIKPTFAGNTASQDRDDFIDGKSGILITNADQHVTWIMNSFEAKNGVDKVAFGTPPVGTDTIGKKGIGGLSDWGGWWGGFSILKDSPHPHDAMRFLDFMYSPEGSMLRTYGIENVHYTINEEGEIVPNYENREKEPEGRFNQTTDENGKTVPAGVYAMGASFGSIFDWAAYEEDETNCNVIVSAASLDLKYADLIQQALDKTTLVSSKLSNVTDVSQAMVAKFNKVSDTAIGFANNAISGEKNLSSDWDAMLASCNEQGFEDVKAYLKDLIKDYDL